MLALALLVVASCGTARQRGSTTPRVATAASRPPPAPSAHSTPPPLQLYFASDADDSGSGQIDLEKLRGMRFVGMDNGPVPAFRVSSTDGQSFDSTAMVGNRPFVIVFFATWCPVCEKKLPYVKKALAKLGPLTVILVSADTPETFGQVPAYLQRHGLSHLPVVRATRYPVFALSYDPFSIVPLVVVVGRNGGLVDFQMGIKQHDSKRLIKAVQLARIIAPLKPVKGAGAP